MSPDAAGARPLIELQAVNKIFRTPAGEFTALRHIDLAFQPGEFAVIMGRSGSGKSTLINMITGIDHPSDGTVRVGEVQLRRMSESRLAVWRGHTLGIVFQFFQLLPTLTVLENVLLPMDFAGRYPPGERTPRALDLLRLMGLEPEADQLPAALSGGEQQIAAIARALANDPPILVADEPTGNLDSRTAARVLDIFNDLARQGKTILIVTHDDALAQRATRRVLIADGELIADQVARALPHLPHPALLRISQQAARRVYPPGAPLERSDAPVHGLHIVLDGEVEILRLTPPRPSAAAAAGSATRLGCLRPGRSFGLLELAGMPCQLEFRAGPTGPVQTLSLGREAFERLLHDFPGAADLLRRAATQHRRFLCPPAA